MPRYKNNTGVDIVSGAYRFPARMDLSIDTFLETIPVGLALVSVAPQRDNVLYSETHMMVAPADLPAITVPDNLDGTTYRIQIYVQSGEIQVRFNADTAEPQRVPALQSLDKYVTTKSIEDIRIHCVANATIWVHILKG